MNRKGFTLIELIMVIVILGILAAIAVPRYVDLTTKAKQAAMDGTLGAIRSAVAMNYADRITSGLSGFATTLTGSMFAEGVIPNNPMSTANVNTVVTTGKTGTGGWAYYPATGTVESN